MVLYATYTVMCYYHTLNCCYEPSAPTSNRVDNTSVCRQGRGSVSYPAIAGGPVAVVTSATFLARRCDDPNAGNIGHKWTLSALLRHLRKQGRNTTALMTAIEDLVVKSVLSSAQTITAAARVFVPNFFNCFGEVSLWKTWFFQDAV